MKALDLFSGIGGFSLGLERAGMETVAFCEYDEKCRQVLKKHWPDVPQYDDVRTLTGERLRQDGIGDIGLICGGYPCQPFSLAGKRKGEADDRHLWPEFKRLIQEIGPTWVLCENVAGHINMGLDSVLADLESEGYQSQVFVIPACAVGAFHRRDRVWIVAHTNTVCSSSAQQECKHKGAEDNSRGSPNRLDAGSNVANSEEQRAWDVCKDVGSLDREVYTSEHPSRASGRNDQSRNRTPMADTDSQYAQGREEVGNTEEVGAKRNELIAGRGEHSKPGCWLPEPAVGGSSDGISRWLDGTWEDGIPRVTTGVKGRADRLKQLGNSVVPQIPEIIGRAILATYQGEEQ